MECLARKQRRSRDWVVVALVLMCGGDKKGKGGGGYENVHIVDTTLEQGIGSSVVDLIPAVDKADIDLGDLLLDGVDFVKKGLGGHASAEEHLGSNSDGPDGVLITGYTALQCSEVLIERVVGVGPR